MAKQRDSGGTMGIFGKKTNDDVWQAVVASALEDAEPISGALATAALAVARDPISGWVDESEIMANLESYETHYKAVKKRLNEIGSPRSSERLKEPKAQSTFFFFMATGHFTGESFTTKTHPAIRGGAHCTRLDMLSGRPGSESRITGHDSPITP